MFIDYFKICFKAADSFTEYERIPDFRYLKKKLARQNKRGKRAAFASQG
jgi:hypothetical protein